MSAPSNNLDLLFGLVANLNIRWKLFQDVFLSDEGSGTFSEAGIGIWEVARECTLDALLMDISRLMDPSATTGRTNLSLDLVAPPVPRTGFTKDLDVQISAAKKIYTDLIKPWRNRRIGHNDLDALTNKKPLPDIPYDRIREIVILISQIARNIALTVREVDQSFVPVIAGSDWSAKLFLVLKAGVEEIKERGVAVSRRKRTAGSEG